MASTFFSLRPSFARSSLIVGAVLTVSVAFNALAGGVEEKSRGPVVEIESKSKATGISTIEVLGLSPGQEVELRIVFEDGREMIRKLKVAEGSNKVSAKLAGKGADMKGLAVKSKPKGSKVKVNGQEAKETQSAQAPIPLKAPRANVAKDVANVATLPASAMRAGEASKDCPECPELVPVPTGDFEMGTTPGSFTSDAPRRSVSITKNFSIGRQEITFAQWEACVADNGCAGYNPADEGWGKGNRPAINISWKDAQRYIEWLSKKTGKRYRLPTEAEWEYAARAGTGTAFWWGREAGKNNANCFDCGGQGGAMTQPVGSYGTNPLGLHDTAGNVWEWTEDCYDEESYTKFDNYPQAVRGGASCYRVVRGGAWDMMSSGIQSSFRYSIEPGNRANNVGFRVVRED